MASIRFSEDIRPLSEFRSNTAAFIEPVQTTRRPIVLTQHGRGAAVLLDVAEDERLVERVEVEIGESAAAGSVGVRIPSSNRG